MPAWRVDWTPAAKQSLRAIPWRDGQRVDNAVMRWAATGRINLRRVEGDPRGAWLHVGRYRVRLDLEIPSHIATVLYVWKP